MESKTIGVIVEVNNQISRVGVYSLLNDYSIIWNGNLLSGIKVGSYLTINQNNVKIIAIVSSEKVIDQQNTVKSKEFDNRFNKGTINRIVELETKGVIENNKFNITSKYTPMVGNSVSLTTIEEMRLIYGLNKDDKTIIVGKTIMEEYPVKIPIDRFFASHIGIFGNTGSGKSNTLHKLYLELFRSEYSEGIKNKSQFFLIDFNGEYCGENMFGLNDENKKIININTRKSQDKLTIKSDYLFDAQILSILFDAKPATQVPFIKKALREFLKIENETNFSDLEIGLLIKILQLMKNNNVENLQNWIKAASNICDYDNENNSDDLFEPLNQFKSKYEYGEQKITTADDKEILKDMQLTVEGGKYLKIDEIKEKLKFIYEKQSKLIQFLMFIEFQRVFEILFNTTKADFINPLFSRIKPAIESLDKVLNVTNDENLAEYKTMNIISLLHANIEVKRLIPMLISKMLYDEHKKLVSKQKINNTLHLIIDEAHNILNGQYKNIGDDWQDYRLSIFEEIIKEGRKFGFYLTLASQRPADISPTIMSQLHNYIIHRLVNEKDLQMISNTMPTVDLTTYRNIPLLGQGEAIITGTSLKIPIVAKIDKEEKIHPNSDDISLTKLWVES